jgi:hypothetical protein
LFFPILNAECSTLEGDGATEEELRKCPLLKVIGTPTTLTAKIDGRELNQEILKGYRAESPFFTYGPLPEKSVQWYFGYPACSIDPFCAGATSKALANGFYLMLAPLSVGKHTIRFTGSVPGFSLDVTYNLTIAPRQPQARLPQSHRAPGLWGLKARVSPK